MSDIFREVDEDIRSDRLTEFWSNARPVARWIVEVASDDAMMRYCDIWTALLLSCTFVLTVSMMVASIPTARTDSIICPNPMACSVWHTVLHSIGLFRSSGGRTCFVTGSYRKKHTMTLRRPKLPQYRSFDRVGNRAGTE